MQVKKELNRVPHYILYTTVRNVWSRSRVTWSGMELLQSGRGLTTKVENNLGLSSCTVPQPSVICVTNFIQPYLHQFSINSHGLNGYGKPLKRPFDRYQSRLEAINNGRDIRQINW